MTTRPRPDLRMLPQPDLAASLWKLVEAIPAGSVVSYGQLAEALGDKSAARWVARELTRHEQLTRHEPRQRCPCFRVIRATGEIGQYAHGDPEDKTIQLAKDGVDIVDGRCVSAFTTVCPLLTKPFEQFVTWQTLAASIQLPQLKTIPIAVAGLDISYTKKGDAVASCVVVSTSVGRREPAKRLWSTSVCVPAPVPYVSGYLVFRELPALVAVYRKAVRAGRWPGLAVIDGSGRLHPRRAGIATCFSAVTGEPSIGVMKSRLIGAFDHSALSPSDPQPVVVAGHVSGTAMQSPTGGKPVFVSPGEGITQRMADTLISQMTTVHRVPEPIYWADRLSREAAACQ